MAGDIVASNALLKQRAESLRAILNADHAVWLFQNNFRPGPQHIFTDFIESTFPGYARKTLVGEWKDVLKIKDGEYGFTSFDLTFTPTAASAEDCFGWYITDGVAVKLSARLPFPYRMTLGNPLTIRIDVNVWATSVLC